MKPPIQLLASLSAAAFLCVFHKAQP